MFAVQKCTIRLASRVCSRRVVWFSSGGSGGIDDPYGVESDNARLSARDKELLKMSDDERFKELQHHVQSTLSSSEAQTKLAEHVLSNHALKAREVRQNHPERHEWEKLQKKYLKALEQREKQSTKTSEYQELLDTHGLSSSSNDQPTEEDVSAPSSNPWAAENLAWVAHDVRSDEEAVEFMPPELLQAQKLNRRQATPIPTYLLSVNNLALLRTYMTPAGQIMPRTRTRLGAKDQRKIAKLIKRARAMGLVPTIGQWRVHDHGNVLDPTLDQPNEWELVLEKAGLMGLQPEVKPHERAQMMQRLQDLGLVEADGSIPLQTELYKLQAKMSNIKLVDKTSKSD